MNDNLPDMPNVGYAQHYSGRNWRRSPDDSWHNDLISETEYEDIDWQPVGLRMIDGIRHYVWQEGRKASFWAQTAIGYFDRKAT